MSQSMNAPPPSYSSVVGTQAAPPPSYASVVRLQYKGQPFITDLEQARFQEEFNDSSLNQQKESHYAWYCLKMLWKKIVTKIKENVISSLLFLLSILALVGWACIQI